LNTGALVRAVEAALTLPFEQGLAIEREEFLKLILPTKPWRCAMSSLPNALGANTGDRKGVLPRTITRVAVIGAGTMGGGIAMTFANAGLSVRLIETSQALLDKGIERIRGDYAVSVKRGSMTQAALDGAMALIEGAVDLDVIAGADLIVEAAFEDMAVKRQIFGQIGRIAAPGAILATNTSYLDVNDRERFRSSCRRAGPALLPCERHASSGGGARSSDGARRPGDRRGSRPPSRQVAGRVGGMLWFHRQPNARATHPRGRKAAACWNVSR
jgi:hypothetical protein